MNIKTPMIQVAGVHDAAEAQLICAAGANMLGFPLRLAFHAPDCSESDAAKVISGLPQDVVPVVICYCNTARETDELLSLLNINAVQLHGDISPTEIAALRSLRPTAYLIKSLVVGYHKADSELAEIVRNTEQHIDCYITDTFNPESGATGATGKAHDWNISARLRELSPRPLILAGGLHADNVAEAIRLVRPAGVDVHTGVEGADGRKVPALVAKFVSEAQKAFAELAAE